MDNHKGLTGQNTESSPKVFSEGDNIIQFLFYQDDSACGVEDGLGCRLGGGRAWEALADRNSHASVLWTLW